MYKMKFKEWRLEKHLTPKQARYITWKTLRRIEEEGKRTEFRHRGRLIPQQKVTRHVESKARTDYSVSDCG